VEERTASSTGLAPRALPPLPPLSVRCPLLLPALAAAAGAWTAARLTSAPVELLVVLVAAGVALRGRTGLTVAWLAAGLLWAQVRWVTPQQALLAVDRSRPVEIAGDVSGCWSADEEGASVTLALRRIAQGERVLRAAGRVRLHLPREPALPSCGGRLAARGYLRPPHVYRNVVEITVGGWSMWVKSPELLRLEGPPGPLARVATLVRRRLFPPRFLPEERPGLRLARALLLGDGGALPQEQREAMRRVGLAHLIAVSGLNVGMVGGLFLVVLLRAPRALRLVGTLAGVGGYALLVGPQPSLLRAVLMAATLTAGLLLRRLPSAANAGNVLRPFTTLKLSLRLPPLVEGRQALADLKALLESDPPHGARVVFDGDEATGWNAPATAPWLAAALERASQAHYGRPAAAQGEGGTIPFMAMLGQRFPDAQFLITGVLGPHSNAHGPNEFLHIPTGKRMSMCVARVVADHYKAAQEGLTKGVAASGAHTIRGGDGCCD